MFQLTLAFYAPIGGEFSGDGSFQDGLAVAGEELLRLPDRLFSPIQPGKQRLDLLHNPPLFVEGSELKFDKLEHTRLCNMLHSRVVPCRRSSNFRQFINTQLASYKRQIECDSRARCADMDNFNTVLKLNMHVDHSKGREYIQRC